MMAEDYRNDPYLQALAGLTAHEPERLRADLIRMRCHAGIAGRRRMEAALAPAANRICRLLLEPALVVLACAVYLSEVLRRALLLYGF